MYRSHRTPSLAFLVVVASLLHGVLAHCSGSFCDADNDYNLVQKLADTQDAMIQVLANRGQTMTSLQEQVFAHKDVLQRHDERITSLEEPATNNTRDIERAFIEQQQLVAEMKRNITAVKREHAREIKKVAVEVDKLKLALASLREDLLGVQQPPAVPMSDCADLLRAGHTESGVYDIYLTKSNTHVPVYCDQDTDGGGWVMIQRREDGSVDFYRDWDSYRTGFGNLTAEFWLGNDVLQDITSHRRYQMRIDLEDFQGATKYATYSGMWVAPESDNYRLTLGKHSGTADDSMSMCNGQSFSTTDRDNDVSDDNCAQTYKGGWWYGDCHDANLNGRYLGGPHRSYADGIEWATWHGYYYSLKRVEMKLRP